MLNKAICVGMCALRSSVGGSQASSLPVSELPIHNHSYAGTQVSFRTDGPLPLVLFQIISPNVRLFLLRVSNS